MSQNILKHEAKGHGTLVFPFVVYHTLIPLFITSFPMHWHEEIEFIVVKKGDVIITMNTIDYHLREGDILVILPQNPHKISRYKDKNCEFFNVLFSLSLLEPDKNSPLYNKYFTIYQKREKKLKSYKEAGKIISNELAPYLNDIIDNRYESYTNQELKIKSDCFMIMHILNKYLIDNTDNEKALGLNYSKIKPAIYYVQNAYSTNVTVKIVADLCNMSESHFMKVFKELTGLSFTAHLVEYRLQMAANQLKDPGLKIIDIATDCGFNNHSYFSRAFIKKYGVTPNEYRKNLIENKIDED